MYSMVTTARRKAFKKRLLFGEQGAEQSMIVSELRTQTLREAEAAGIYRAESEKEFYEKRAPGIHREPFLGLMLNTELHTNMVKLYKTHK